MAAAARSGGGRRESERERFVRVAEPRVRSIIKLLRGLGAMNRAEYGPPSQDDVELMIGALEREIGVLRETFRRPPGTAAVDFSFDHQKR